MANIFRPEPIVGGDLDIWGNPELAQNRIALGIISCQLYDDAGTLKITKGKIGLIDSSAYGTIEIDTITTISIAGITNGNWFKVEISRTGTTPVIEVTDTDTGVDTDPTVIPTDFTDSYDAWKGGFYIDSEKRCIAVGYKEGGGDLDGIVNAISNDEGYIGIISEAYTFNHLNNVDIVSTTPTGVITVNTLLSDDDGNYIYFITGAGITVTLPAAPFTGRRYRFISTDGNNVTFSGNGNNINESATVYLVDQNQTVSIIFNGTEWFIQSGEVEVSSGAAGTADGGGAYVDSDFNYKVKKTVDGLTKFEGWGWVEVDASAIHVEVDITMPITYTRVDYIFVTFNGKKAAADPTSLIDAGVVDAYGIDGEGCFLGGAATIVVALKTVAALLTNTDRLLFSVKILGQV